MPGKLKAKKEPKKVRNLWDEDDAKAAIVNPKKKGLKEPNPPKKVRKHDLYEDDEY